MAPSLDLSQVDLMNFRVEYVRLQSGQASERNVGCVAPWPIALSPEPKLHNTTGCQ